YGDVVQLDGTQSYDADGYISRYEWYFNNWTNRYPTVSLSADDYQPGENTVRLQVRDNGGAYGELEKTFVVLMDSDRDGVLDDIDLCPSTPSGASVDEYGCAFNGGGDGGGNGGGDDGGGGGDDTVNSALVTCPVIPVSSDDAFLDNYPEDNIDYIGHNYHSVRDIERAFNHARHTDNSVTQYLKMPSQQQWDALTLQEQGLYPINAERRSRGLKPCSCVSDEVAEVAQQYADLIFAGNAVISDYYVDVNGNHTPHDRLAENDTIGEHQDAGIYPESIYSITTYSAASSFTESEILVAAIYGWIYEDKNPLSGNAWGHRDQLLQVGLNENHGEPSNEGLLGFGISVGAYDPGYNSGYYGGLVVLNTIDQGDYWPAPVTSVDITEAQQCNNYVSLGFGDYDLAAAGISSITISPFDFNLPVGGTRSLTVTGETATGDPVDLTPYATFSADDLSIVEVNASVVTGLNTGYAYLSASVDGIRSNRARVTVGHPVDTNILAGTRAEQFLGAIPDDATAQDYDPRAVTVYTGKVYDADHL